MKAIVLEEPLKFTRTEIDAAPAPSTGEALVRVHRMGICGTDLSCYKGTFPFVSYPRILGHELGVEIVEVGAGVDNVKPGDRCSVEPYINDPESYSSRLGASNCCENVQVLGVHCDGGLRSEFVLPARKLHAGNELEMEQLALVETLAIGCHAIDRGQPQRGQPLLVIGAGPIGLSVVEFARLAEAEITVLDLNEERLAFCEAKMGVHHTVALQKDGGHLEQLKELTQGHLYPIVVDATGNVESMSSALEYVAHTGKLVYVGITTSEIHFPHPLLHRREMTLLASRNALPRDFARIINHIRDGEINTETWITHRVSFDHLIDEFAAFTRPETGAIKAIVQVED